MPELIPAINVPTVAAATRTHNAVAQAYGWTATISDGNGGTIPNPETKAMHTHRKVREYLRDVVKGQEMEAARKSAEGTVTEVTLT